ncbi:PEP-CTERM sorting domain-containing protein, partial [bacterium]
SVFTAPNRNFVGDDFNFAPVGTNPAATVDNLVLGYYYNSNTIQDFDIQISIYKDMDLVTTDPTTHVLSNLAYTTTYRVKAADIAVGANETQSIDVGGFFLGSVDNTATSNHGIELKFLNAGTSDLSSSVTALFKGDMNPTVGESADVYYRESNGNGFLDGGDARNFASSNLKANLYMRMNGDIQAVPEPASMTALALGGLAMLRRRKRS